MLFRIVVAALTITILTALHMCLAQTAKTKEALREGIQNIQAAIDAYSQTEPPPESQPETQPTTQPATQPAADETRPAELTAEQREKLAALWKTVLNENDEASAEDAARARRTMIENGEPTVLFLAEQFAGSQMDKKTAAGLIADLDSEVWRKRNAATVRLKAQGFCRADMVLAELESANSPEAKLRLEEILDAYKNRIRTAVEILVSINSEASWAAACAIFSKNENAGNTRFMDLAAKAFMSDVKDAVDMFFNNRFYYATMAEEEGYGYVVSGRDLQMLTFVRNLSVKTSSNEGAMTLLDIAIRLMPGDTECYASRGWVRFRFGRHDDAYADLTKAIELEPDKYNHYIDLAALCMEINRLDDALAGLNKALTLAPDESVLYMWRGRVYLRLDRKDETLADFNKAIEMNPEYGPNYIERADVYEMLGRIDEAMADIDTGMKYVENNSYKGWLHFKRASLHSKQGRTDKFIEDMKTAIDFVVNDDRGSYANWCNNLAWFYVTCEDPKYRDVKAAVDYAQRACQVTPRNPAPLDTLGCAYADDGQWKEAVETEQKAIECTADAGAKQEFTARMEGFKQHKTYLQQEAEKKKKAETPATQGETPPATQPETQGTPKATTYTCLMHPNIELLEPGKCPTCGMNLIPEQPGK